MSRPRVLSIIKPHAEPCVTQSSLNIAGLKLVTATNMDDAHAIMKNARLKGIIICRQSWTEEEREDITAELWMRDPEVAIILRCPGCAEHDELNRSAGTLRSDIPLTTFITAINSPLPIRALI